MSERKEYTIRAEFRGTVMVTRIIEGLTAPYTKWDLLSESEQRDYENTAFTANGTGDCSQCGEHLATEADFAKHFIISDLRYMNLGDCKNARLGSYQGEDSE
jgi:hypothetical protein